MSGRAPPPDLRERVRCVLGSDVVAWRHAPRGYTLAERWSVVTADGRRAFVKRASSEDTARWPRIEHAAYRAVDPRLRPSMLAFDDADMPMLVLEDLADAHWPPPWRPGDVAAVREALDVLHASPAPAWAPDASELRVRLAGWDRVALDPARFLLLGLCSAGWLERALPVLLQADRDTPLTGDAPLHLDVRSDNICLRDGRAVLVDWNWIRRGNPALDVAAWLPSLAAEGGAVPEEVLPGAGALAGFLAGYFAANAPTPPPVGAPRVREAQLGQLRTALPWAARELGLDEPDGELR